MFNSCRQDTNKNLPDRVREPIGNSRPLSGALHSRRNPGARLVTGPPHIWKEPHDPRTNPEAPGPSPGDSGPSRELSMGSRTWSGNFCSGLLRVMLELPFDPGHGVERSLAGERCPRGRRRGFRSVRAGFEPGPLVHGLGRGQVVLLYVKIPTKPSCNPPDRPVRPTTLIS